MFVEQVCGRWPAVVATCGALFVTPVAVGDSEAAGLVAAYGFEEGSGATTADASGKGHTGTIREATWTTAGHAGSGLTFDGTNDWVTVANAADLNLSTAGTIEAYVRPTATGAYRTAVIKETSGDLAYADATYKMTYTNPNTSKVDSGNGYCIWVFRKQSDGSWKIVRDVSTPVPAVG